MCIFTWWALRNPEVLVYLPAKLLSLVWATLAFIVSRVCNRLELELNALIFGGPSLVSSGSTEGTPTTVGHFMQQPSPMSGQLLPWAILAATLYRQ